MRLSWLLALLLLCTPVLATHDFDYLRTEDSRQYFGDYPGEHRHRLAYLQVYPQVVTVDEYYAAFGAPARFSGQDYRYTYGRSQSRYGTYNQYRSGSAAPQYRATVRRSGLVRQVAPLYPGYRARPYDMQPFN